MILVELLGNTKGKLADLRYQRIRAAPDLGIGNIKEV